MPTVDLLKEALGLAEQLGYTVRQEWLDGGSGGPCELRGKKLYFVDLALSPADQLDLLAQTLAAEPNCLDLQMTKELRSLLNLHRHP